MPPTSPAVAAHPLWGKAVSAVVGGAGAAAVLYAFHSFGQTKETMLIIAGGLLAVALLLILYRLLLGWWQKRKAAPMTRSILANSSAAPHGISDPAKRAKLDEMRKSFETGVAKFRAAGKDLYTLPWFVLVGEPGGGKTEAIRHSQVGFPHGLQDYMQGAGGTVNMNWWFTNHAIILDTAGRLMFEEVAPGTTNEWGEFLSLLRQNRPNCPINGMVLVIPADTLIKDSTEAIERKAGKIAQQLDLIQRTLEVRFPVFVVISKCDLVSGFREFFETVDDPQLQGQIMGWSNPMSLDQPFNPEMVDEHLKTVRQRLARRRYGLLLDPVHTEDPNARRIDQVDALYTFPDALARIGPRLRRYLEMIFVAGEWSPKPLFLRGIYFTSSMREGAALDAELAEVLKVPVDSLQDEGRAWERNKTFFLREPFLKKIFVEKGLVTRASRPNRLHRARKVAVLGFGFLAVLVLSGLTFQGARRFKQSLGTESDFWPKVRDNYPNWAIIDSSGRYNDLNLSGVDMTLNDLFAQAQTRYKQPIKVPEVFKAAQVATKDFSPEQRKDAYRAVYEKTVLEPLLREVRSKLSRTGPGDWTADASAALKEMVKLEAAARSPSSPAAAPIQLDPLFKFALRDDAQNTEYNRYVKTKATNGDFAVAADWLYSDPGVTWPPSRLGLGTRQSLAALEKGVRTFREYWEQELQKPDPALVRAGELKKALDSYKSARAAADSELQNFKGPILTRADYDRFLEVLGKACSALEARRKAVEQGVAAAMPGSSGSVASIEQEFKEAAERRNEDAQLAFSGLKAAADGTAVSTWLGPTPRREMDDQANRLMLSLKEDLEQVDVQGLGKVRRYAAAEQVYLRAQQERTDAGGTGASASVEELSAALDAISTDAAERDGQVGEIQERLAAHNLKPDPALKTWKLALQSGAAARRNAAVAAVLKFIGEGTVEEQVSRAAESATLPHPATVPFTGLNQANHFQAEFTPGAAQKVLRSVRELRGQFPADSERKAVNEARASVLDYDALRASYNKMQSGTGEYVKRYVHYWTTDATALASFKRDQLARWGDFFNEGRAARRWNADTINTALGLHADCVSGALRLVNEFGADDDTRDAVRDKERELNAARGIMRRPEFIQACRALLENWQAKRDPAAARRAIIELTPAQLPRYVYRVDGGGFVTDYWYRLSYRLLEALAEENVARGAQGLTTIAAKFDGFPLTLTGRKDVTRDELAEARAALVERTFGGWPGEGEERPGTIGLGARPANFDGNALLDQLVNPLGGTTYLPRLRKVFDALLPPPQSAAATCTVALMDKATREKHMAQGTFPPDRFWSDIRLKHNGKPGDMFRAEPAATAPTILGKFNCTDPSPIVVEMSERPAANAPFREEAVLRAPWAGLRLVLETEPVKRARPRDKKTEDGGQVWDVEVIVRKQNKPYSLWLVVTFDRELPKPGEWTPSLRQAAAN